MQHIISTAPPATIRTATGEIKTSTATARFNLPGNLPPEACTGHIIPGFTNNLISLGKLCDNGCTAVIDKHTLLVNDPTGHPILHGCREPAGARLWRINITPRPPPTSLPTPSAMHTASLATAPYAPMRAARAYDLPSTPALVAYLHATAGYPVRQTWLDAIKRGAYATWPGLTYTLAARHCPTADETYKGHMAQPRQHLRSTRPPVGRPPAPIDLCATLDNMPDATDFCVIPINQIFSDDTGRFAPRARSGNQYIMVALHRPSNAIIIQAFQSKQDNHRIAAYQAIYARLKARHMAPTTHILDNEVSAAFQRVITSNNCTFQLVPPHVHRRNAAERAIRTFKDHFLSILAGVAPTYPRDRWDLLLPQAELTLNLLRASPNPTQSAWDYLFGTYNFDATPMGPAGCRVLLHHKPTLRKSWDYRTLDGYYIGPALQHYRCYRAIAKASGAAVISDAVKFCHHYLPTPTVTLEDKLLHALQAIHHALRRSTPRPADEQIAAIQTIRTILHDYKHANGHKTHPMDSPPGVDKPPPGVRETQPVHPSPGVNPRPGPPHPAQPPDDAWTLVGGRPRRAVTTATTPDQPIASRTRSRTHNAFAALADDDDDTDDTTHIALPVLDVASGKELEHRQLRRHPDYKETWDASYANELGRLCQGIGHPPTNPKAQRVEGTDTFRPIHYEDIPSDRRSDVTYTRVVCEVRPQKADPNRTRITIGGNRICYPGDTGTKTGSLELVKLLLNSVLSTKDARFACFDISNFYLGTPLDRPEYVRIKITDIPDEFVNQYNLTLYTHGGWVYFEINKGVYGLKQAGRLANDLLTERLSTNGYYQCHITPGLWRHQWRPVVFVLIVDDFGIQYQGKRHADHLLTALQQTYTVTTDWTGTKFAGIDLTWNYALRTCRLCMYNYIETLRLKYNHSKPAKAQHSPHAHREIVYGAKEQLVPDVDNSPPLDENGVKRIQGIVGSLLYYARAVDNKLLATLSTISAQQAKATQQTEKTVTQLLDYVATYPNDGITYRASNMILSAHSDASFLTETGSRSRAGAHIYLSEDDPAPRPNGPVLSISQIMKYVMASAAEAELGALYLTAREMIPLRHALDEMGWKQPRSPIQTDNSTAAGFVNDTIIQRRIKMIWMRLHWLRCRAAQGQFRFHWAKGSTNMADYHTKHHPPAYHMAHRATHAG